MSYEHIYFFIDDTGVLDVPEHSPFFCYSGYMILGTHHKSDVLRQYSAISNSMKEQYDVREVKGSTFDKTDKSQLRDEFRLMKIMYRHKSVFPLTVRVDNARLRSSVFHTEDNRTRFKNYILKRLIKDALCKQISVGLINPDRPLDIKIFIDEEAQRTSGIYSLDQSIYSEALDGIHNWDFGAYFEPFLYNRDTKIKVDYVDSATNRPVQCADILANLFYYFIENDYDITKLTGVSNFVYRREP
ncbi:DUF3800 domain-containing protein [Lacticaseibacillus pabuli]|uniref:DUF3800 domain-containing protein n=1 Tax=Lacticaseibacillus pabuli TaxID=3025672 RepID=A0ABY7WU15_9LACO|nr:DUF3800 domain-containing protein [Lacticaseibacillus sp. KACC 23028]WDF83654.1 DUF3800 domain-containing protein [Lacticaseibacillus sp. KACC 23028]